LLADILQMSEVGLTETVHSGKGSDARKFELWLQGECVIFKDEEDTVFFFKVIFILI
jgi:hypothetical protein